MSLMYCIVLFLLYLCLCVCVHAAEYIFLFLLISKGKMQYLNNLLLNKEDRM